MRIQAVVFDWGGTLSEFVPVEMVDMWRLAARHLDPDREEEIAGLLIDVEERFWARTSSTHESGTLADLIAEASRRLGLDVAEAVLEEAAVRHLDAWTPHIRHDPDAGPVLAELRRRGIRTALLSNTHWPRTFHEHFLERDGLADLLEVRLYTSEMERMKPHPDVFHAALGALDVTDPACSVFVGDRPHDDIAGAKGVGMRAVLRRNAFSPAGGPEPDAVVERLPDLLDLVDAWST